MTKRTATAGDEQLKLILDGARCLHPLLQQRFLNSLIAQLMPMQSISTHELKLAIQTSQVEVGLRLAIADQSTRRRKRKHTPKLVVMAKSASSNLPEPDLELPVVKAKKRRIITHRVQHA